MERAQNYGITVLHPNENSADRAVDESDIVFEYVSFTSQSPCEGLNRHQLGRHSWPGRRSIHDMDTRQGPAHVAAGPFASGHAQRQSHDLRLQRFVAQLHCNTRCPVYRSQIADGIS